MGVDRKFISEEYDQDEWESFDANNGEPNTGLFYLYDSALGERPVVCYCKTKQLLHALYDSLLYYSSRSRNASVIGNEWSYMNHDEDGHPTLDNWTFYNTIKSSLIEWNHDSHSPYRNRYPRLKTVPPIRETVHMWPEWGDGLFWHQRGGCCGNAESFFIDTENKTIDLSDIPELRKWYDEFEKHDPCTEWLEEDFILWFNQGWTLAKQIRKRLPPCVDLFYHWKPYAIEGREFSIDIPYIVPNENLLIVSNNDDKGSKYSLDAPPKRIWIK